jgi:hypothetical protein
MKQLNIPIINTQAITQTIYMPSAIIKGATSVNFILTGVSEDVNDVLFADIDWGDGSTIETIRKDAVYDYRSKSIVNEVLYGKLGGSVCTFQQHEYNNTQADIYGLALSASFVFYYDNGAITTVYQPLVIYWGSFYDEIKELVAINTQIQPISTNRTFVNLESKQYTQILPCLLDVTGLPKP